MNCHQQTCLKGHWKVRTAKVLDVMDHLGETYALVATRQGHEVICVAVGAWILQLQDNAGWKQKTRELLEGKGRDDVADAVFDTMKMNDMNGLDVRSGVWK